MIAEFTRLALPFVIREAAHLARAAFAFVLIVHPLDMASLGAEIGITAIEKHILPQRALDASVENRKLHRRLQSDAGDIVVIRPDYPHVPAGEILFQAVADAPVELVDIVRFQTVSVGWICHHHARLGVFRPFRQGTARDLHHLLHLCRPHVPACYGHGLRVDVAAVYLEGELTLVAVVIVEPLEEVGVEIGPFLEGEMRAVDARVDVGGDEGGLDQECSGAAHRVHEIAVAPPSGLHDDAGGERLVDRGLGLFRAVTALRERLSARIERDGHAGVLDVYVQHYVGPGDTDRRSLTGRVAEMVHDAVFHAVGGEFAVGELLAVDCGVDCERGLRSHVFLPFNVAHDIIQLVGVACREFLDGLEYPQRGAAAQVCLVHHLEVSLETDHAASHLHVFRAQAYQLVAQHVFKTLEGLGDHREGILHICRNIFS